MNLESLMCMRMVRVILIAGIVVIGVRCSKNEDSNQAPTVPSNLAASNILSTSFTLSWDASTDDQGVAAYEVFRNGTSIGTTSDTFIANTSLTKSTVYTMTVRAIDTKGKMSAQSAGLNVSTAGNPSIINTSNTKQIIRGFGGATVFQPTTPLTNDQLDKLFGTGTGQLGLSLLRIRVAADASWRAVELANAKGAKARGVAVFATPWSPPASMKTNASLIGGSLNPSSYADYAKYLNDFADYMASNDAPLYAISIQNEPDIVVTYESCSWSPTDIQTFLRDNAGAITSTKVISPESFQFIPGLLDPSLNDVGAAANIDIVGGHIYGGGLARYTTAFDRGKEVWMTEHYTNSNTDGDVWSGSIGAMGVAKEIHDCMTVADFSAYVWWYLRRFYGPLSDATDVITKRGWVMSQYSKFIRPGYYRVDATANPDNNIYVSAYKGNGKTVIVAINQSDTPATQSFTIQNETFTSVTAYRTSATENMVALPSISLIGQEFSSQLPPQSITTFVSN